MQETTNIIQEKYGETARSGLSSNHSGIKAVAEAFGYTAEELASIPFPGVQMVLNVKFPCAID